MQRAPQEKRKMVMTFKQHLSLIVGGAFFVLFIALGYTLFALSAASRQTNELVEHTTAAQLAYTNLYASGLQTSSSLRGVVLDPKNKTGYTNLEKGLEDFDKALAQAKALPPTRSQSAEAVRQIEEMHQKRKQLVSKATELVQHDVGATIEFLNKEEIPLWRRIREVLLDQVSKARADTLVQHQQSTESASRAIMIGAGLTLLALSMAVVSLTLIMRSIDKSLGGDPSTAAAIAHAVAEGNLTVKIGHARPGSVLDSMQEMQTRLIASVTVIRSGASLLSDASAKLSENGEDVAKRIQRQSDDLSEMAASIEQLTTSIRVVADLGSETSEIATGSGSQAETGATAIGEVVREMNIVQETVNKTAGVIDQLGRESERIAKVVETIREVADQTNLLALNAAIEAARAGDAGRGFAVVADEVRKLAERTTSSTKDITETIDKVRSGISDASTHMTEGVAKVANGRKLAISAGEVMERILQSSRDVLRTVREIAHSIAEQSSVSTQIAQRVESISVSSDDNRRTMDETVTSTLKVRDLSHQLKDSVQVFQLPA
jgi:methyl-accepting chemotaxis protein